MKLRLEVVDTKSNDYQNIGYVSLTPGDRLTVHIPVLANGVETNTIELVISAIPEVKQ